MIFHSDKLQKFEFEARIFISFAIVIVICAVAFLIFADTPGLTIIIGNFFGLIPETSLAVGYLTIAIIMMLATLLRTWAGSVLTSHRMMNFRVQVDSFISNGPYRLVRNPIYLADLVAFSGFALCLPPIGLLMPVLLYLHYRQLVKYEEISLREKFPEQFQNYAVETPRLIPSFSGLRKISSAFKDFRITKDGFRHNMLYLLFIPGFVVSALTREFLPALFIGLPAVIDWAIVHIKLGLEKSPNGRGKASGSSRKFSKKVSTNILYANCWEDPQPDRQAFNIQPEEVVFSITSGGCNLLTFLLDNPQKIIALDLNRFQNYLLELKIAAFHTLSWSGILELMGVAKSNRRRTLYHKIRPVLSQAARHYWDGQEKKIDRGIINCGRYEWYMGLIRKSLRFIVGQKTIDRLFRAETRRERQEVYHRYWNNFRWRVLTRILLSRFVMSLLFDKAFFAQLESNFSFGKHFFQKAEYALTQLPVRENYFLSYILLGNYYSPEHLPPYLRRENFEIIRSRVNRVEIVTDSCEHYFSILPDNSITKFNFTNIFEWMPRDNFENLLKETVRVAKHGAIMTYRNLLVHRGRPASLEKEILPIKRLAKKLHRQDLSFIYNNYVIEKIVKEEPKCHTGLSQFATAAK